MIAEDFRKKMQKALKQRKRLAPVRLELSRPVSEKFSRYLQAHLPVEPAQIFVTSMPLKLGHVFSLESRLSPGKARRADLSGVHTGGARAGPGPMSVCSS